MSDIKADGPWPAVVALGLLLGLFVCKGLPAQIVYKTVDESGHETYSTTPPPDGAAAEVMMIEPAPLPGFVPPPTTNSAAPPGPSGSETDSAEPQIREVRYSDMTLGELDTGCEAAREARIAPIRTREIALCKASRSDPDYCERFYRDLGEPSVGLDGTLIPGMFNDLPECKLAEDERHRRATQSPDNP